MKRVPSAVRPSDESVTRKDALLTRQELLGVPLMMPDVVSSDSPGQTLDNPNAVPLCIIANDFVPTTPVAVGADVDAIDVPTVPEIVPDTPPEIASAGLTVIAIAPEVASALVAVLTVLALKLKAVGEDTDGAVPENVELP